MSKHTDLFADFALPTDTTSKCYIVNPATRQRLKDADGEECWIETYGYHSESAQKWRADREETLRKLGRDFNDEENEQDLGDMLARLTVNWQLVAPTGKRVSVECNYTNAKKLYTSPQHRWMRQQLIEWLGNLGNFLPDFWKG
jgi:hypothetical protein